MGKPGFVPSETGLPVLPDGYFFRVYRNRGVFPIYPMVEIREKYRGLFGREKSRCIDESHTYGPQEGETVRENIIYLAGRLAERFYQNRNWELEPDYSGDYPPQKI